MGARTGRDELLGFCGGFADSVPASLSESSEWVEECPVDEAVLEIIDSLRRVLDAAEAEFMYGSGGLCGTTVFDPELPVPFPSIICMFFHSSWRIVLSADEGSSSRTGSDESVR